MASSKPVYPLGVRGEFKGGPYQGSHSKEHNARRGSDNWESENAVDLAAPVGTPVYAVQNGTIGSQIGPLNSSDPQMAGQRVHLVSKTNEFYYAHLSQIVVKAGQKVRAGQLIGYSGEASGLAHLHFAVKSGNPEKVLDGQIPTSADTQTPTTTTQAGGNEQPTDATPATVPTPTGYVGPQGSALERPYLERVDYSTQPQNQLSTWQMIAQQPGGVSPDTLRYADLAGQADGSSS